MLTSAQIKFSADVNRIIAAYNKRQQQQWKSKNEIEIEIETETTNEEKNEHGMIYF